MWKFVSSYKYTFSFFNDKGILVTLLGTELYRHEINAQYTEEDFFNTFICDEEIEIDIDENKVIPERLFNNGFGRIC